MHPYTGKATTIIGLEIFSLARNNNKCVFSPLMKVLSLILDVERGEPPARALLSIQGIKATALYDIRFDVHVIILCTILIYLMYNSQSILCQTIKINKFCTDVFMETRY